MKLKHNASHSQSKMRIPVLIFFLLASSFCFSQTFPESYVGHWKGSLDIYNGSKKVQTVVCALDITPADSGRYDWVITYGDSAQDRRPYLLIPIDTTKGHWAIDEQNGIVIDMYVTGNKVTSLFTVMGSAIQISYWREGEDMMIELFSYPEKADVLTGKGTEDSPEVKVFKFSGYQLGRMHRNKSYR